MCVLTLMCVCIQGHTYTALQPLKFIFPYLGSKWICSIRENSGVFDFLPSTKLSTVISLLLLDLLLCVCVCVV